MQKVFKMDCIILAGGKGTRLGEVGKTTPKSLLKIHGKPIIKYVFENLPDEIDRIIVVVGHLSEKIREYLGTEFNDKQIDYLELEPKGTGYAVWQAKDRLKSKRFLVVNGDDIYDKNELTEMLKNEKTLGLALFKPKTKKYFSIKTDGKGKITGYDYVNDEEIKNGALVATGAYVLDKEIFDLNLEKLSGVDEYGLPQTILKNLKNYPITGVIMKKWFQINHLEDVGEVELIIKNIEL